MFAVSPEQCKMFKQFHRVLEISDARNNQAVSENKEVDNLLLAIDKWFYRNPFMDFRGESEWPEDVVRSYDFSIGNTGKVTHSINLPFVQ